MPQEKPGSQASDARVAKIRRVLESFKGWKLTDKDLLRIENQILSNLKKET